MKALDQAPLKRLRRKVFERHANPWSAWTRLLSGPLVLLPFWTRRWEHAAGVGAWMLLNPVVFPKPMNDGNWATRAILGEELWLEDQPLDRTAAVNAATSVMAAGGIVAAWKHRPLPLALLSAGMIGLTLGQWQLMAQYYERHRQPAAPAPRRPPGGRGGR